MGNKRRKTSGEGSKEDPKPTEEEIVASASNRADDDDNNDEPVGSSTKHVVVRFPSDDVTTTNQESPMTISDGKYRNKQRCLVLCSRGVTARYRHLLEDLRTLIPHHKKESKLDCGNTAMGRAVTDICEMRSCNSVLFLECRKRKDCYMWLGLTSGPSVKFHVSNIHTMDELRLTGNCMRGSRPVLSFDDSFENVDHLKLLKELFTDVFGTPRGHPKSKPFVDRVMAFYYADKRVS
jgi:ribosome biogenesis protein BRX1